MALAARLPKLCTAASSPNADPRSSTGASAATAACSAVSTQPMATPAARNQGARARTLLGAGGEAAIGQPEQPHAQDQDQDGGEVVGDIEAESQLGGPILAAAGAQQLAGPQDQQGGGHVAELEGGHPD